MLFFPRLGCPSFGSFCIFSKTWLSKFWYVVFFQDLVVQVLVHFVFFPRLGRPSFGSLFFQDLVVQVLVYAVLPRLGCPSFGLFSQDLGVQVLVYLSVCSFFVSHVFQDLVSKFW